MDNNYLLIFSCAVSYVLLSLIALVKTRFLLTLPDNALLNSALSLIIGTVLTVIVSIIYSQRWFTKTLVKLFHKTQNGEIWKDVIDFEKGANLKVYIKGKDHYIIGGLKYIEENGPSSWIVLAGFSKYNSATNIICAYEPNYTQDNSVLYMVRLEDIEHIEVFSQ